MHEPTTWSFLCHAVIHLFRAPLLLALLTQLTHPWVARMVPSFRLGWLSVDETHFIVIATLLHAGLYTGYAAFFGLCDSQGWLARYKVRRTPRMAAPAGMVRSTLIEAAVDMVVVTPCVVAAVGRGFLARLDPLASPLPSLGRMTAEYVGAVATLEVLFYATHRALHEIPFLYRTVHKKHHRYVGSITIAAEWAHPVEKIFSNGLSTLGFHMAMGGHMYTVWVWLWWRLSETYEGHSGYCFKESWLGRHGLLFGHLAEFHDYHHSHNRGNYGNMVFMDYLLGTAEPFLSHLTEKGAKPTDG